MKIKPPKLNIPEDDPFAEDILEREESAKILTQFISTIKEPYVLAIDSPWGTGKTTFIQMWSQSLKNDGYPCIYINAWENDFSDDPLVSLIGEIDAGIDNIKRDEGLQTKAKENFKKVKKIGSQLLKKSIPIIIKTATSGIIDVDKVYGAAFSEIAETTASDIIDKYSSDKTTIKEFKNSLNKFVKDISPSDEEGNTKPLILFIDELDRCRPDFAIELLEKAKHFFNIDNIIFVLALDKEQIGHSIRSMYGVGMDVDGYLGRFIDLDYNLPEPSADVFCNALFKKLEFSQFFEERTSDSSQGDEEELLTILSRLFKVFNFSLRDQEHCLARLSIALRTTPKNHYIYPTLLGALIILKAANPKLYTDYIKGAANSDRMLSFIGKTPEGETFLSNDYVSTTLEAYFVYADCNPSTKKQRLNQYNKDSTDSTISENKQSRSKDILQYIQHLNSKNSHGILQYLTKKIEIAEQFIRR